MVTHADLIPEIHTLIFVKALRDAKETLKNKTDH